MWWIIVLKDRNEHEACDLDVMGRRNTLHWNIFLALSLILISGMPCSKSGRWSNDVRLRSTFILSGFGSCACFWVDQMGRQYRGTPDILMGFMPCISWCYLLFRRCNAEHIFTSSFLVGRLPYYSCSSKFQKLLPGHGSPEIFFSHLGKQAYMRVSTIFRVIFLLWNIKGI